MFKVGDKVKFKEKIISGSYYNLNDPETPNGFNNKYYGKVLTIVKINNNGPGDNFPSIKLDVDVNNRFSFRPSRFEKVGISLPDHLFEV